MMRNTTSPLEALYVQRSIGPSLAMSVGWPSAFSRSARVETSRAFWRMSSFVRPPHAVTKTSASAHTTPRNMSRFIIAFSSLGDRAVQPTTPAPPRPGMRRGLARRPMRAKAGARAAVPPQPPPEPRGRPVVQGFSPHDFRNSPDSLVPGKDQ